MITEDYVSFETAKLLKEKGFDGECKRMFKALKSFEPKVYDCPEWITNEDLCDLYQNCEFATIPTFQMAMKWLREVHNLDIIAPPQFDNVKWTYSAIIFKLSTPCTEIRLNDNKDKKEAAYETAIKYCLENLI